MLHGVIPASFFATLLQRYFDGIAETRYSIDISTADTSGNVALGTSAAVASIGVALYGLTKTFRKKSGDSTQSAIGPFESLDPKPEVEHTPQKLQAKRRRSKNPIKRKRRNKKQWFLKHMRHYKSKYGRQFGKVMNKLLGIPFTESPLEPLESDTNNSEESDNESMKTIPLFDENYSCQISTVDNNHEKPSKDYFDDDDEDVNKNNNEISRRTSGSSIELRNIVQSSIEKKRRDSSPSDSLSSIGAPKQKSRRKRVSYRRDPKNIRWYDRRTRSGKLYNDSCI